MRRLDGYRLGPTLVLCLALIATVSLAGADGGLEVQGTRSLPSLVWLAVITGIGGYSILELLLRLTPLRAVVQRQVIKHWLGGRSEQASDESYRALRRALQLTAPAEENAVLDLPPDQLVAQISLGLEQPGVEPGARDALRQVLHLPGSASTDSDADAFQHAMDALQVLLDKNGKAFNDTASFVLAVGVGAALSPELALTYPTGFVVAVAIGGPLSWILRDLLSRLD